MTKQEKDKMAIDMARETVKIMRLYKVPAMYADAMVEAFRTGVVFGLDALKKSGAMDMEDIKF